MPSASHTYRKKMESQKQILHSNVVELRPKRTHTSRCLAVALSRWAPYIRSGVLVTASSTSTESEPSDDNSHRYGDQGRTPRLWPAIRSSAIYRIPNAEFKPVAGDPLSVVS